MHEITRKLRTTKYVQIYIAIWIYKLYLTIYFCVTQNAAAIASV